MELIMLGTGSPLPDAHRAGPSQLVIVNGRGFLIDCGRGCLMRLAAAGMAPGALDQLLITHMHSDHVCDVNDLITTRWVTGFPALPLPIVGPLGTQQFVDDTLTMLGPDIGWRVDHHQDINEPPDLVVAEVEAGVVFDDGEVKIIAAPTEHKPVHPTVGYRIEAEGAAVVLAGDTVPCAALDELCTGADVYVQTVVREDIISVIPVQRLKDVLDYHSSVADAAKTAQRTGVKTLVLNHCVPAPPAGTESEWVDLAAEHFDGEILLPADLDRIPVGN